MKPIILSINPGSSSLKFSVFELDRDYDTPKVMCRGVLEGIKSTPIFKIDFFNQDWMPFSEPKAVFQDGSSTVEQALYALREWFDEIGLFPKIPAVSYRIVHGGDEFNDAVIIDQKVLQFLKNLIPFAPLHQPFCLDLIRYFQGCLPGAVHIANFDTAFHRTMPTVERCFAIPKAFTEKGIKPYGFHGLSYQYIVGDLKERLNNLLPERLIVAHLGSGASLCAISQGKSVATTMTFSPLDGVPMATRCGSIDAAAVLYMVSQMQMGPKDISELLNQKSGLLGLSGISGDVRTLQAHSSREAVFALEYFVNRIVKELGSLIAVLNGVDAIVFTGGIGTHSVEIREAICQRLQWVGVDINHQNNSLNSFEINMPFSQVKVYTIKTDEEFVLAKNALNLLKK